MADGGALCRSETQHGQAGRRLTLANGDTLWLALQGAHVVSWQAAGRERLYVSPRNVWDGHSAIRGGVPVCFPQFNQRGSLPKHGFARNSVWTAGPATVQDAQVQQDFTLSWSAPTLALWQSRFEARLRVALAPGALTLTLTVHDNGNSGTGGDLVSVATSTSRASWCRNTRRRVSDLSPLVEFFTSGISKLSEAS